MLKFVLTLSYLDLTLRDEHHVISASTIQSICACGCVVVYVFRPLYLPPHTSTHTHHFFPYVYPLSYHALVHLYTCLFILSSYFLSTNAHLHVHLCVRTFLDRTVYDQSGVPSSDVIHILRNTR